MHPASDSAFCCLLRFSTVFSRAHSDTSRIELASVRPLPATLAYTGFLDAAGAAAAAAGSDAAAGVEQHAQLLLRTCACMAPCMRLYAWLGSTLAAAGAQDAGLAPLSSNRQTLLRLCKFRGLVPEQRCHGCIPCATLPSMVAGPADPARERLGACGGAQRPPWAVSDRALAGGAC